MLAQEDRPVWAMLIAAAQELLVMHQQGRSLSSTALLHLAQMVSEEARFVRRNGLSGAMVTSSPTYRLATVVCERAAGVEDRTSGDLAVRIADALRDASFVDPDDDTVPVFGYRRHAGGSPGIDRWIPVAELVAVVLHAARGEAGT